MAYFLPMTQFPLIDLDADYEFILDFLEYLGTEEIENFDLISGYLNPTDEMIELISELKSKNLTLVGAAPEVDFFLLFMIRPIASIMEDFLKI